MEGEGRGVMRREWERGEKGRKRRRDRGRKRELMCERRRDKFICQLCCPSCSSVVDYTSCVRTEPFSIMALQY